MITQRGNVAILEPGETGLDYTLDPVGKVSVRFSA